MVSFDLVTDLAGTDIHWSVTVVKEHGYEVVAHVVGGGVIIVTKNLGGAAGEAFIELVWFIASHVGSFRWSIVGQGAVCHLLAVEFDIGIRVDRVRNGSHQAAGGTHKEKNCWYDLHFETRNKTVALTVEDS